MTIKAIQTAYAGCLFRSRLEARWAVFFDAAEIRWEYEPQGFQCTHRLTLNEGTFPYLPDFWLPELGFWAEVKGSLTAAECVRLLDAAASLSSNDGGGCHDAGGNDVLVLGPVDPDRLPWRLHMHKGGLEASPWRADEPGDGAACCLGNEIAADYGGSLRNIAEQGAWGFGIPDRLVRGAFGWPSSPTWKALVAARSARFEHGHSGATL